MKIKKILILFSVLFIACSALHLVEHSSAAIVKKGYLIDHGEEYSFEDYGKDSFYKKYVWNTYWYSKNTRKTILTNYCYYPNSKGWTKEDSRVIILTKISKTKMKIKVTYYFEGPYYSDVTYVKTKLSIRNFYWEVFRPNRIINGYYFSM